jgi:hypothetical protein
MSIAWPASPVAEINWSMMPQLTPTHSFSARCASSAISVGCQATEQDAANARAAASSSAALELSPAPTGTSPIMMPSHPQTERPACRNAQATPRMYSTQPPSCRNSSAESNSRVSPKSSECTDTRPSRRGRTAIHTARSIAIGRTKPSL